MRGGPLLLSLAAGALAAAGGLLAKLALDQQIVQVSFDHFGTLAIMQKVDNAKNGNMLNFFLLKRQLCHFCFCRPVLLGVP